VGSTGEGVGVWEKENGAVADKAPNAKSDLRNSFRFTVKDKSWS
jgi:hypothetical protein